MREIIDLLSTYFTWQDAAAVAFLLVCLNGWGWLVESPHLRKRSVATLMADHRRQWMERMAEREGRIVDSNLLNIIHRGAGFFASASLIAIGGIAALIGQADRLLGVASDLVEDSTAGERVVWEVKLLFLLCLMTSAFLKFVWAHRLYGYCAVLIGATPEDGEPEERAKIARMAASVNIRAGRSFNRGLQTVYFSLATLGWILGPEALAVTTLLTTLMLYRREFRSETQRVLDI
ncbi:DUF599 domain-containing protein [Rhodobacteraceae bacterium NNCM2]|nr:DUF599 domain-containing protein [Coraliihabitans acroporae]